MRGLIGLGLGALAGALGGVMIAGPSGAPPNAAGDDAGVARSADGARPPACAADLPPGAAPQATQGAVSSDEDQGDDAVRTYYSSRDGEEVPCPRACIAASADALLAGSVDTELRDRLYVFGDRIVEEALASPGGAERLTSLLARAAGAPTETRDVALAGLLIGLLPEDAVQDAADRLAQRGDAEARATALALRLTAGDDEEGAARHAEAALLAEDDKDVLLVAMQGVFYGRQPSPTATARLRDLAARHADEAVRAEATAAVLFASDDPAAAARTARKALRDPVGAVQLAGLRYLTGQHVLHREASAGGGTAAAAAAAAPSADELRAQGERLLNDESLPLAVRLGAAEILRYELLSGEGGAYRISPYY